MARTVKWTEAAVTDLAAAAEFIARDSSFYASALVREARTAALSLRYFAERGRRVPEGNEPNVRELFLKNYRLIYRVTPNAVFILAPLYTVLAISPASGNWRTIFKDFSFSLQSVTAN